uniref:Uncharacterized protein n=1 Tax=Oryza rufipogon TaxID=4529 RepID=A0A0E0R4M2_ORYRU
MTSILRFAVTDNGRRQWQTQEMAVEVEDGGGCAAGVEDSGGRAALQRRKTAATVQARDDGGRAADVGDSGGCASAPVSLRAAVWWPRELATEAGQRKAWPMLLHLGRPHKLLKRRMQPDNKLVVVSISLSLSLPLSPPDHHKILRGTTTAHY